jgi:4-hydroxymandelate oxidase
MLAVDTLPSTSIPAVTLEELEAQAKSVLSKATYDYFAGGAEDEAAVVANREAFSGWRFRFHVLTGASEPDLSCSLLGHTVSMPVQLAPTATQRLAHPDGELAACRAAAAAGVVYSLSTLANTSVEDVAAASHGQRWFQLYMYQDRGITTDLLDRAIAAGYGAILFTVDAPVLGRRERDLVNAWTLPDDLSYANLTGAMAKTPGVATGSSGLDQYFHQLEIRLTWKELSWLAGRSRVPVLVKGIVRGDDARRALAEGARGVIVSNHGGRQLDHSVPTLDALPEVVEAIGSKGEVLLDGGVRRGTDILKALALGARSILIGRPVLWALAAGGQAGVKRMLDQLREEMVTSMILLGVSRLDQLTPDLLSRRSPA